MAKTSYQKEKSLSRFRIGEKFREKKNARLQQLLRLGKESSKMMGAEPFFIDRHSKVGVLVLHGFTSTPYQFRDLGDYLALKGLTVYAPLIAGHGTSPRDLIGTNPEDWKNSAKESYFALKAKVDKVVIIGNSFGGNLAFHLARVLPEQPAGIISLGAPIVLRFQWIIKLRLFLYGWAKTYYIKPRKAYKIDYTDMSDEITYPVIPIKSLREFLNFLKTETAPNLNKVKCPVLVAHANVDPVVHPKSAAYIYRNIGSVNKRIYWFNSVHHVVTNDAQKRQLFEKAYDFIKEIT